MSLPRFRRTAAALWIAALAGLPAQAETDNAAFAGQNVAATMIAGRSYTADIRMTNSGDSAWTADAMFRLGAQNPQDNKLWGLAAPNLPSRALLEAGEAVEPGASKAFSFTVTAPAIPGTYDFQWRMVHDGVGWFGETTKDVPILIRASAADSSRALARRVAWSDPSFGCNSVAMWQLPHRPDLFLGRVLMNADAQCNETKNSYWTLALGRMDWNSYTIRLLGHVLSLPAKLPGGETVTTAYDPSVAYYNDEYWAAFECGGDPIGGTASTCMGPLKLNGGIDLSRTYVAVHGAVFQGSTALYSASVPKLLRLRDRLYLYWSAVKMDAAHPSDWLNITTRGVELKPVGGLLWPAGAAGGIDSSDPRSVEVWGVGTDKRSDTVADVSQVFTDGRYVYALAGRGGSGTGTGVDSCMQSTSSADGCYRMSISRASSPLGPRVFNGGILPEGSFPSNHSGYGRVVFRPDGTPILMGQFLPPGPNAGAGAGAVPGGHWMIPIPAGTSFFFPGGAAPTRKTLQPIQTTP